MTFILFAAFPAKMMGTSQPGLGAAINTSMTATMNASMMSDALSDPSSPESAFDDSDLITVHDDVTHQLANAGMAVHLSPGTPQQL